jgi:L-asparaginase
MQAYDMTSECAVTKLMWALGHTTDLLRVREMMYTDYCGEITLPQSV